MLSQMSFVSFARTKDGIFLYYVRFSRVKKLNLDILLVAANLNR